MADASSQYRPDTDGLRALAILSVLGFHAFPTVVLNGFIGVDVFFVISGYLIGGIIISKLAIGNFSFLEFYKRRIRRLLPALAVVYLATVLIGAVFLAPGDFNTLTYTLRGSVLLSSNFAFAARTGYFDPAASTSPLIHTWSLSVEEQFYLVIPLLLWFAARRNARMSGAILIALACLSFTLAIHGAISYPAKAFFLPHTRAWELLIGVLLARYPLLAWCSTGGRMVIGILGLLAIALAIWAPVELGPLQNLAHATLACLGAGALIESGRYGTTLVSSLMAAPPFVYIGLISYPLYLWHWPLLVYSRMFVSGQNEAIANGIMSIAAFILADLTRRFVEVPLRFRFSFTTRGVYTAFVASTLVFVAFSLINEATKGLPIRFSGPVRAVLDIQNEWRGSQRLQCMSINGTNAIADRSGAENPCRMGRRDAPISVVLWGDSHGAAMQPGLSDWLERNGLGGVAVTFNCHPVEVRAAGEEGFRNCDEGRNQILESFLSSSATTLVLAMRWNRQVEGPMPMERGYRPISDAVKDARAAELHDQLKALAEQVTSHGKRLVFVYTVPEMNFDVPDGMGVRMHLGMAMPQGPSVDQVLAERERTMKAIRGGLQGFEVNFVDPLQAFCTERCQIQANGAPLYFDNNHLSIAAENIVFDMFDSQLPRSSSGPQAGLSR